MSKSLKRSLIFVLFFLIQLYLLIYFHYDRMQTMQMYVSNQLYSRWNVILEGDDVESVIDVLQGNHRLFVEHNESGTIRTIFCSSYWTPPMLNGDFLEPVVAERQAVVGRNIQEGLDGNMIRVGDSQYRIIGTLGVNFPTTLDSMILLNHLPEGMPTIRMIVDTNFPHEILQISEYLDTLSVGIDQSLSRFLNSHFFTQLIRLNVYIITMTLMLLTSYLYLILFQKADQVLHLLGHMKRVILLKNIACLSGLYFGAFLVLILFDSFLITPIIAQHSINYILVFLGILLSYSTFVFCCSKKGGLRQ